MMATVELVSAAPAPTACGSKAGWLAINSRPPALQKDPQQVQPATFSTCGNTRQALSWGGPLLSNDPRPARVTA